MIDVRVVLLAAGQSTRFWPLPHKLTLPFVGKTLVEHHIELLKSVGLNDVIIVGAPEIKERLVGENIVILEQKGAGQAAAILSAKEYLDEKPLLILNADDVVAKSLFESLLYVINSQQHMLVGYKTKRYFPGGYLALDGKRVVKVHEKPDPDKTPSSFVRLVCDYFTSGKALLDYLTKTVHAPADSAYEEALSLMMKKGEVFEMLEYEDTWLPLKFPWHTISIMDHFLHKLKGRTIAKGAKVARSATIIGDVFIGEHARVMEYAKLVGPLYIGAGTIIGNHTMVRHSQIGDNCVVGFGTDMARSYVGDNVWFHSNYIGDSVIASDSSFGAGTVLANLRLDESEIYSEVKKTKVNTERTKLGAMIGEGARVGINAQIMPGIKIGAESAVGPGVLLQQDVEENKRVYIKQVLQQETNAQKSLTAQASIHDRSRFRKEI